MAVGSQLLRTLSEPDCILLSHSTANDKRLSNTSSSASLLRIDSQSPFPFGYVARRSHSFNQLAGKHRVSRSIVMPRFTMPSPGLSSSSRSSNSSTDEDSDEYDDKNIYDASEGLQYTLFDEMTPNEDLAGHHYLEKMMFSSIPRRREFSEQFRDLAQLHEQGDVPRAKWDDASRLFPKQFGLPASVAINIWKHVDSDADMMLTEAEYCLAAHLANKYSTTGFSLLPSQHQSFPQQPSPLLEQEVLPPTKLETLHQNYPCRSGRKHRSQNTQSNTSDTGYPDNDDDDSHDFLLSPDLRPLGDDDDETSWNSSKTSRTYEESTEDEEEEDDQKGVSDDEIGVRALLPPTRRTRRPVAATALLCDENEEGESDDSSSSSSSFTSSSSQESTSSQSSSSPSPLGPRVESVCSTSSVAKTLDPVEVLCKFTHRSGEEVLSLPANRRRRLLASLVRTAKSTNHTLLRLNNELAGELQELCDQHTNLKAQVRHLSEMGM